MRILICTSESPRAPLNGSRLLSWHLCSRLARDHEVTVVALRYPDQDGSPPDGVQLYELPMPQPSWGRAQLRRLVALALCEPVEARRLAAPFRWFLPQLGGRFDVAHVMLGPLARVAPALDVPAVIVPMDAWHLNVEAEAASATGWVERAWRRTQVHAARRFQSRAYRPYARVILVAEEDAREVRALDPSLTTETISIGVDTASFAPDGRARSGILFTGVLNMPANEQAAIRLAERIMPLVRRSVPEATLSLVGRSPSARVRALDATVVPDVPDLRPYLWGAGVYACPMASGTGMKYKLLEAMAAGAPAVATSLACQGLTVRDGVELRIADGDEAFAAALVATLRAPGELGEAARQYVIDHHDWDAVAKAYAAVYEDVIS
ncbi:glycosyltransferase [Mycobacterium sp. 3519A]|uniref:glycosyltransferase n=1 Tax=Mycobacterium sp. 3519A TaxID=2057184 RepID=UPI000C7C1190|nr:glycosyltransferase [Mycobacterium sp. 3519A]